MEFINLSNHTSQAWSDCQKAAAMQYGTIQDLPFPQISPELSDAEMNLLVEEYTERILQKHAAAVMLQGEAVFSYRMTNALKKHGITVLAAMSERCVKETQLPDGTTAKQSVFRFKGFRRY